MITTVVDQNECGVYYLHIYDDDKVIFESYNDRDEMPLHEMAELAHYMYELGRDQSKEKHDQQK